MGMLVLLGAGGERNDGWFRPSPLLPPESTGGGDGAHEPGGAGQVQAVPPHTTAEPRGELQDRWFPPTTVAARFIEGRVIWLRWNSRAMTDLHTLILFLQKATEFKTFKMIPSRDRDIPDKVFEVRVLLRFVILCSNRRLKIEVTARQKKRISAASQPSCFFVRWFRATRRECVANRRRRRRTSADPTEWLWRNSWTRYCVDGRN